MKSIFFIVLLLFARLALADSTTGNELYSQIISQNANDNLRAYAYISGVLDTEDTYLTIDAFTSVADKKETFRSRHFCFGSDKVTMGQITDIIKKYLERNPETRHKVANYLISLSLVEAFPCAKNP